MSVTPRRLATPDEWLLARYDADPGAGNNDERHMWNERPIFQVLDDHPSADCDSCPPVDLVGASWPSPKVGDEVCALDDLHDPDGWHQVGAA
jgi:hypothetical protein